MDPKPQMPDIKAEVLKTDDGKKKSAGLLGLLGGGGGGAAGGLGGLGAGAVGGGGLLATKAGILALVLMGSAVAGGIGLAGYKMFGPGEADRTGGNLSLFAPRAQPAEDPNAVAPVAADGSSASLNFAAAAAAKDKAEEAAANASASAAAPTDNTAGDPAKEAAAKAAAEREAAARAASGSALNATNGGGAAGSMSRGLANTKKLGALSSNIGGGGASTSASASSKLGDNLASAAKNGGTNSFAHGGAAAKASNARGIASRGGRSARSQARAVMGDQGNGKAGSSFAAGRTYDGSTAGGGGSIGPDGGAIGMGGVGDGASAQPKTLPANSKGSTKEQDPPVPEPPAKDVTPWAKQIMMGMALGAAAIALLYAASSMLKDVNVTTKTQTLLLAKCLAGIAIAMALAAATLGAMIAGGKNGQTLQGGLLIASSLTIAGLGGYIMSQMFSDPATDGKIAMFSDMPAWIMVIGGAAAVALVGTMMAPKKTCKSDQEGCHASIQQHLSPTNYTV